MNPIDNPYAPGAGTPPPQLAGRDEIRESVRIAVERIRRGRSAKSILMVGLQHGAVEYPGVVLYIHPRDQLFATDVRNLHKIGRRHPSPKKAKERIVKMHVYV